MANVGEPEHVRHNRRHWERLAEARATHGSERWRREQPVWGEWGAAESELTLLPDELHGRVVADLGCGTGYVSGWMARRGATVIALDPSPRQLELARGFAEEHGCRIRFVLGTGETVPLQTGSCDFAISEYGSITWSDPFLWVPEAWRVLRPGGALSVLGNHPILMTCVDYSKHQPAGRHLEIPYFGLHRLQWVDGDDTAVNFNLTVSAWMDLFRQTGFEIVAYHELQAPRIGGRVRFNVSDDWARSWPAEQVWKLRKPGLPDAP